MTIFAPAKTKYEMKRIVIVAISVLTAVMCLSSCEEIVTSTYWIQFEEGSDNFTYNLYLQMKVSEEISFEPTTGKNSFFGSEEDATVWFNEKMDYLESKEFAEAAPVVPVLSETSASFSLISSYGGETDEDGINTGRKVTTRTVHFTESSVL